MKRGALVVVERELLRLGRRWQTMGVRAGFALTLLAVVTVVYVEQLGRSEAFDVARLQGIGRSLYVTWAWMQFVAVVAVTPLLVGQAIIDEKDEQTLELLAITRLSASQILWGKLVSRLIGVESMLLAGLPVLAIVLGFGGVAPSEVFGAFVLANVTMLVTGAVATFLALYARSPVVVALQTWGWLWIGWAVITPILAATTFFTSMGSVMGANPGSALGLSTVGQAGTLGASVIAPSVIWTVVAAFIMYVAALCFDTLALGNRDPDSSDADLSVGAWSLRRLVKWLWIVGVACVLSMPLMLARGLFASFLPTFANLVAYVWLTASYAVGGVGWLLLIRRGTLKKNAKDRAASGGRRVGWKKLAAHYDETELSESGSYAAAGDGQAGDRARHVGDALAGRRARRSRLSPFTRDVWDDPVAWRESVTAAHGQLRRGLVAFYVIMAVLFAIVLLAGGFQDDGVALGFGANVLGWSPLLVLLLATSSIVGERRAGSLELLCATRLTAVQILRGKLKGVAYYIGPALLLGALLMMAGSMSFRDDVAPPTVVAGLVWYFAALFALAAAAMWRALAVKAPSQAWGINLMGAIGGIWILAFVTAGIAEEAEELAYVWGLVVPFVISVVKEELVPTYLWLSAGFWLLVGIGILLRAATLMRRRAAAM